MGEIAERPAGYVTVFAPEQTREKLAFLDGEIVRWRKLQEWPALEAAVAAKVEEQAQFVANWDARVQGNHRPVSNATRHYLSVAEAVAEWGIGQPTVSRWRGWLQDRDAYCTRIMLGAYRKAGLTPEENHRAEGTGENEWFTPAEYVEAAREVMGGIDLDPATHEAAQRTVQAVQYYTKQDDGLRLAWHGRVWLNPPYAQPYIAQFVDKLASEFSAGAVEQAVLLTHNYTDTTWFHRAAGAASLICFTRGRIRFVDVDGGLCAPTQGQAFCYFGGSTAEFIRAFSRFGFVVAPCR
jgi:phage N-6-adenine-methyltransferase